MLTLTLRLVLQLLDGELQVLELLGEGGDGLSLIDAQGADVLVELGHLHADGIDALLEAFCVVKLRLDGGRRVVLHLLQGRVEPLLFRGQRRLRGGQLGGGFLGGVLGVLEVGRDQGVGGLHLILDHLGERLEQVLLDLLFHVGLGVLVGVLGRVAVLVEQFRRVEGRGDGLLGVLLSLVGGVLLEVFGRELVAEDGVLLLVVVVELLAHDLAEEQGLEAVPIDVGFLLAGVVLLLLGGLGQGGLPVVAEVGRHSQDDGRQDEEDQEDDQNLVGASAAAFRHGSPSWSQQTCLRERAPG